MINEIGKIPLREYLRGDNGHKAYIFIAKITFWIIPRYRWSTFYASKITLRNKLLYSWKWKCGTVYGNFECQKWGLFKILFSFLRNAATQIQTIYLFFYIVFLLQFFFKLLKMRSINMAYLSCIRLQIHWNLLEKVCNKISKNNINKIIFLQKHQLAQNWYINAL